MSPSERRFQRISPQRRSPYSVNHSGMKEKPGAPPTESLFSPSKRDENNMETDAISKESIWNMRNLSGSPKESSFLSKSVLTQRRENEPQSPTQLDPFYTQGTFVFICN